MVLGCGSREQHDFEMSFTLSQFSIQSRYLWYRYRYRYRYWYRYLGARVYFWTKFNRNELRYAPRRAHASV